LNQADSEEIARRLAGEGVRVVDRPAKGAAAFVINTCSVTHVADHKARHAVRLARRLSPNARVVLTGCYAETAPPAAAAGLGADVVTGNSGKAAIADRILESLRDKGDPAGGCAMPVRTGLRTRAFIKIQEGCDELCAFCIVPYTRGRERSVPIEDVVREVRAREAEGVLEVVLTGTQLGNYGRDLGWPRLEQGPARLLERLLEATSLPRIRMSSVQPQDIHPGLLSLWSDPRLCPHFHIPLQSGSDAVLGPMRRRYNAGEYKRALEAVRAAVPAVAVTTDVIAGFPGETDDDFDATIRLCEESAFAAMHCFPYSRRPHTGAEKLSGHLPPAARKERLERLLEVARRSSEQWLRSHTGATAAVLWEKRADGYWQGLTADYARAYTASDGDLENKLLTAQVTGLHADGLLAML
jgi:threonylcarbamoyladenosine tRNA methylthiotransferase MtaB